MFQRNTEVSSKPTSPDQRIDSHDVPSPRRYGANVPMKRSPVFDRVGRRKPESGEPGAAAIRPETTRDTTLFDEALLARLRRLVLLSRRSILYGIAGEHRSKRRGSSPEFSDFKSYSPGDDYRRIDWNIYGRLDEVFVRMSEISTELTVHLLIDSSASMDWRGDETSATKSWFARRLAGALGYVSLWHFDRIHVTPFGYDLGTTFGPVQGRSHITPMFRYLTNLPAQGETALPSCLSLYASRRRQPGVLYVISDLLSGEPEDLRVALRDLRTRGWETTIVHVIDPDELAPDRMLPLGAGGRRVSLDLIETETGTQLRITPTPEVLERYRELVDAWLVGIEQACAAEETEYVRLRTDASFESLVLARLYEAGVVR